MITGSPPTISVEEVIAQIAAVDPLVALSLDHLARFVAREGTQASVATGAVRSGGIAVLPIHGALMPRAGRSFFGSWPGMDTIRSQLRQYANDPEVAAIVLDVDSPGGTVAGTAETGAAVREAAAKKPVVAVANTLMASAAYWIGSQASELVIAPGSDVGSIGAMMMHTDLSKAFDNFGVKLTMIRSAPYKNESAPFAPLSDEAKAHLQARVDDAGAEFIKAVAEGRRVSQTKVKDDFGQGRVYGAREAVARGMGDRIATLDDVIASLAQKPSVKGRRRSALSFE